MTRTLVWPAAALAGLVVLAPVFAAEIEIVSRTSIAVPLNTTGDSRGPVGVSPDGRYAVFFSDARNLVPGDTNHARDVFLYDHASGNLERVNLGAGNVQANGPSPYSAGLSADARYVVFESAATNLVAADTHGELQIYLRDRVAQTTTLVSRRPDASAGDGSSYSPQISADGRYVVFASSAALVANDTNTSVDVYRYDRTSGLAELMSVSLAGTAGNGGSATPRISADGRYVAFITDATDLLAADTNLASDIILRDTVTGTQVNASLKPDGSQFPGYRDLPFGALSADGRFLLFNTEQPLETEDTNTYTDGFRFDRTTGLVERVTRGPGGTLLTSGATGLSLSADGARLLMESTSGGIVSGLPSGASRSYVRDLTSGAVSLVKLRPGALNVDDETSDCALSGDAGTVYCASSDRYLTDSDGNAFSDVFRSTVNADGGLRVSRALADPVAAANGDSADIRAGASEDGRFIVFGSLASNLVVGDFNGLDDVFLRDRLTGTTQRISRTTSGGEAPCASYSPQITPDGRYVLFASCGLLASPSAGAIAQVYRYDRVTDHLMLVSVNDDDLPSNAPNRSASLSDDGQYVAFISHATNLHGQPPSSGGVFLHRIPAGPTVLVNRMGNGSQFSSHLTNAVISGDGHQVYFSDASSNLAAGDTNGVADVFAYGVDDGTLQRVSLGAAGQQLTADSEIVDVSRDGRHVLFRTRNFVCPYSGRSLHIRDRNSGETDCVGIDGVTNQVYSTGSSAAMSADGSRVMFTHEGRDVLVHDRATQRVGRITPPEPNGQPQLLEVCPDGSCAVFSSSADNIVDDDANGHFIDVFLATAPFDDRIFRSGFEASNR